MQEKTDATQPKDVVSIVHLVPPPPSPPPPTTTQIDKGKHVLHLDDIPLTPSPCESGIALIQSTFILQSQQVAPKFSNISNNLVFMGHASISYMLGNGATENPVLILAFEFVNKVIGHVKLLFK